MGIIKVDTLAEYTTVSPSSFVPIVDIYGSTSPTNDTRNKKISISDLRKAFYTNQNGSSSFVQHTPGFYYFGDNSDGPGNFSGSITTLRTRISNSFSSSLDGPPVIKNFSSLFVSRSVVISPVRRCRGMLIFVDGDATISGSISMTARGASFVGTDASFQVVNPPYVGDYWNTVAFPSSSYLSRVFATGASGALPAVTIKTGGAGINGRSGGGGGGGGTTPRGAAGSNGTSFSGGTGGGGSSGVNNGFAGFPDGGQGGTSASAPLTSGGGAGAGNPAGTGGPSPASVPAPEGTGGLLILIVRGNLKIGPNGSITANGIAGASTTTGGAGGGGGSGGGIIYIYYGGSLTNNGTTTANGGAGGISSSPAPNGTNGGDGGAGTVVLSRLNVAFPVAN